MITPSTRLLRLIISALSRVVNPRPGIAAWVGSGIGAKAPGDEFVCLSWTFKLVCVLAVQTSLQVDDGLAPAVQLDVIVVAGPSVASGPTPLMRAAILDVVEGRAAQTLACRAW